MQRAKSEPTQDRDNDQGISNARHCEIANTDQRFSSLARNRRDLDPSHSAEIFRALPRQLSRVISGYSMQRIDRQMPHCRQPAEQTTAGLELLRMKIAVEQAHQPASWILRDASVAAR
jgi:hypothetical protein